MSYNPPTETQVRIRSLADENNIKSRAHFAERARLRRKAELKRKLIKLVKIGVPILIIVLGIVYWMFLR